PGPGDRPGLRADLAAAGPGRGPPGGGRHRRPRRQPGPLRPRQRRHPDHLTTWGPRGTPIAADRRAGQASQRLRDSTTQTGLAVPSRSTVIVIVVWTPPGTSTTSVSSAPARRRDPTGTGLGKRTRPVP